MLLADHAIRWVKADEVFLSCIYHSPITPFMGVLQETQHSAKSMRQQKYN
jgi:hypothetical protein